MTEREQLELMITEAADGMLTKESLRSLEQKLLRYPDLLEEYRLILQLPDVTRLYGNAGDFNDTEKIEFLFGEFDRIDEGRGKADGGNELIWFSRYAVAASMAIFAVLSVFYLTQGAFSDSYLTAEELFYPMEESAGEDYVLYLNELFESN